MAKGTGDEEGTLPFGVSEGAEIKIGTLAWNRLTPVVGSVLEVLPVEFINWTGCRRLVCRPRDRMDWTSRRDGEDSQRRVSGRRERIALRGDSGCSCRGWSFICAEKVRAA